MASIARYERFDNDGIELVIDMKTGESFATVRGYARMSGLNPSTVTRRLSKHEGVAQTPTKTVEILTPGGKQGVALISEDVITEWIFDDNPTLAKAMLKAGVRVYLHTASGYTVTSKPFQSPFWYARVIQFLRDNKVPDGYWSVFRETMDLVAQFEAVGCVIPDNAVPDISVGKCWANHLRSEGIEPNAIAIKYPHTYPWEDPRGTRPANAYPDELLPRFRKWFKGIYRTENLTGYIKTRHRSLLPYVSKILEGRNYKALK
jgi:hypothetical protein